MIENILYDKVQRLQNIIDNSNNIVFFGGAGVSTESGIPDFRSVDGLYNAKDPVFNRPDPEYYLSHECLEYNPKTFFAFYRKKMDVRGIEPNITHYKLVELEKAGKLSMIITQNIDGLHQKAGSKNVAEIHGTTMRNYCRKCGAGLPNKFIGDDYKAIHSDFIFTSNEDIPHCPYCGGMIRPDVVLYGESLPNEEWDAALKAIMKVDTLIVAGTSMNVYPAAYLVQMFHGKNLVVINRDVPAHMPVGNYNTLIISGTNMGEVFKRIRLKEN